MNIKKTYLVLFAVLLFAGTAFSQLRLSGTGTWSVATDSSYTATITRNTDLTGNSYTAAAVSVGHRVVSGTAANGIETALKLYRIDSVASAFSSTVFIRVVEMNGTQGAPTGLVYIFNPDGRATIPSIPVGTTGATAALASAIETYNSRMTYSVKMSNGVPTAEPGANDPKVAQDTTALGGNMLYRWDGVAWEEIGGGGGAPTGSAGGDLTGTYPNPTIAANAVDSSNIAAGGVGNTDIQNGVVSTTKIADDAITLAKQASGTANRLQGFDASGNPSEITVSGATLSAGALTITASGVDTLYSYTALRAYTGAANAVIVKDFSKTSAFDAVVYETEGGLFYRVPSGTENGGTLISATNGVKWKRLWEESDGVRPEWAEIGGYNASGVLNTAYLTSTDGIHNESDRLNWAATIAGANGKIVLKPGKTYTLDIAFSVKADGQYIEKNKAILKRKSTPVTTYVSSVGSTITVASSSGFRAGQNLLVTDNSAPHAGRWDLENFGKVQITGIVGNVITYSGIFLAGASVGDTVIACNYLLDKGTTGDYTFTVVDGFFDGNYAGNPYTHQWNIQPTVNARKAYIRDCDFQNAPCENIFIASGEVRNCTGKNLSGSFIHTAGSLMTSYGIKSQQLYIVDNRVDSVCLSGAAPGHDEGAITHSIGDYNVTIAGNRFRHGLTGAIGQTSGDGDNMRVENNVFIDFKTNAFYYYASGDTLVNLTIKDNQFINCGDGIVSANVQKVDISGNTFYNARLQLENLGGTPSMVTDNQFYYIPGLFGFTGFSTTYGLPFSGGDANAIWIKNCQGVKFSNNIIVKDTSVITTRTGSLTTGIYNSYIASYRPGTRTILAGSNDIAGNTMANFRTSIANDIRTTGYVSATITNNVINMWHNLGGSYGIITSPGISVTGNRINLPPANSNIAGTFSEAGILVTGVTSAYADSIPGAMIERNTIIGKTTSGFPAIRIADKDLGTGIYNNLVQYNTILTNSSGTYGIIDASFGNSEVILNKVKVFSALQALDVLMLPKNWIQ